MAGVKNYNINVIQNGEFYNVHFPYDQSIVALLHNVPGARWEPNGKHWVIPSAHLGWLINEFKGTRFEPFVHIYSAEELGRNESFDSVHDIPDIDISDIDQYVQKGSKLYQHQIDFLKYAKAKGTQGFVLADEPGLGKTLSVMNYALYRRKQGTCKHCLIIACVNAVKYNWKYDIDKHTNGKEEGYLLGTRLYKRKKGEKYDCTTSDKYEDLVAMKKYGSKGSDDMPFFMIMNIEAIQYHIGKGKNAVYPIADAIVQLINSGEISMIAVDECHKNMSPTSIQGKLILEIKKAVGRNAQWIPMSGTPIVNRPTDLYTPLRLIDAHSIKSFYTWCEHFTVSGNYGSGDVLAYKNIPQLKALLERNMIRRTKAEALDLPAKIDIPIYVENTTYQKHLYASVAAELASAAEEICQKPNPMTALLRLRQVNGSPELVDDTLTVDKDYIKKNAKLAKLLELVDEITSTGEKVIVFSNWVEPLKTLYKFIAVKYKTACFTGTMSEAKREQHKKVFINDPECKVLIGTIDAMGISHTFAVATNAIFYDEPWTMAAKIQAQDRIHRIGTTKNVNYFTLLTANTVDDRVHQVVYDKGAISDYIVDGKLDIKNNPDLFMKLLGNY